MGCQSCSSGGGSPKGCKSNGNCGTSGCNRMNTHDWISTMGLHDPTEFDIVEVSFAKGSTKNFYKKDEFSNYVTGDRVVVSTDSGYNVGHISLSGELVRLQMKKKRVNVHSVKNKVLRKANERDLEKLHESRSLEHDTLLKSRVIARNLGLDMKLGDIEYQADGKKAIFYYTAEGRIDFRNLVKEFAREFKVKVEMRQIGARQESGRIGGIGSCGRELCCSTWLSDFQTVTTSAARYQNIAINQTKLSGQCGRLKCCLNYELDTYMDALKVFPEKADWLKTKKGKASLIKTDIFKGLMYYCYVDGKRRGPMLAVPVDRVKFIQEENKAGRFPEELLTEDLIEKEIQEIGFADVTGQIELPNKKRKKRRNNNNRKKGNKPQGNRSSEKTTSPKNDNAPKQGQNANKGKRPNQNKGNNSNKPQNEGNKGGGNRRNKNRNNRNNKNNNTNNQSPQNKE